MRRWPRGTTIGLAASFPVLAVLGAFGLVLPAVRDDDTELAGLPGSVMIGAVLGVLGWALHLAWAARTRS